MMVAQRRNVPKLLWTVGTAFLMAVAMFGIHQTFFVPPCGRIIHAAAECPVGSTDVFSNNIGLQSGGTFTGTLDLITNPTADFTLSINHADVSDTIPVLGQAHTWAADQTYNDNTKITLGTGGDADIYYDGTDLIIDPSVVGSGNVGLFTSSPEADLHIDGNDGFVALLVRNAADGAVITAENTNVSPSAFSILDVIGPSSSAIYDLLTISNDATDESGNVLTVQGDGNISIGTGLFPSSGTAGLVFGDGTALSGMGTNTAGLFGNDVAGMVELFAIDEAGNATQLSPHPPDFLNTLPLDCALPWAFQSTNPYIGKTITVDLCGAIQALEILTGQAFITVADTPVEDRRNWADDQQENFAKCLATGAENCVKKQPPQWMIDRGVASIE